MLRVFCTKEENRVVKKHSAESKKSVGGRRKNHQLCNLHKEVVHRTPQRKATQKLYPPFTVHVNETGENFLRLREN